MTYIRRALLALVLSFGLAPAFAQVPAAVPALPDTERRTSYSITATTCACNVNFALYGDSTDYQNWVEVFINGVRYDFNDASHGWTITSPSGSLSTLARPITNAVLTFNAVQTGTVQIVGARRPRRTSQFSENAGVSARNLNQLFTDIISQNREIWDKNNDMTGRGLFSQPGNTIGPLPLPSACANGFLGFDATGLIPRCLAGGAGSGNMLGPVSATLGNAAVFGATPNVLTDFGAPPVGATRTISTTAPLSGGGDLSVNRTHSITTNGIDNTLIRQSAALSLVGRAANSTGNVADISAVAASSCAFIESGSTIICGQLATAGIANNAVTLAKLATQAANTTLSNATSGAAVPTAFAMPSCSTSASALNWTTNTGFGCNSAISVAVANVTGLGTGVGTALAVNVGSAGAFVTFNGALGTPSSGTGTNLTGIPISTAVSGLGSGVATMLGTAVSAAGGPTTTIASGTSAMGTSAIASAACATVVTTAATNTATTDAIIASFNGDPTAVTGYVPLTSGMLTIIVYPTANNVNFKVCNNTSASITPGAITLNWRVVR